MQERRIKAFFKGIGEGVLNGISQEGCNCFDFFPNTLYMKCIPTTHPTFPTPLVCIAYCASHSSMEHRSPLSCGNVEGGGGAQGDMQG